MQDAMSNQRLQLPQVKEQQWIGNKLNWLIFLFALPGFLIVPVCGFQTWSAKIWSMFQRIRDLWSSLPLPPAGVCIGLVAVTGVFMPFFWSKINKYCKSLCIFLFFGLLCVEILSISEDRREAQKQFETTAADLKNIISNATGGNSYLYFDLTDPSGPLEIQVPDISPEYIFSTAVPHFVGEFPLHDVVVSPFCPMGWLPIVDYRTVYPQEIGRPRQGIYLEFPPTLKESEARCVLFISTSNGSYSQIFQFSKQDDKWTWASKFGKYDADLKREFVGPGFPKDKKW
jgi:hypothetical protein